MGTIPCPVCGAPASRQLSLPAPVLPEPAPYYDHGLGTVIRSRAQRRALMKANNLVEKGTTHLSGAKGTIFSHPGQPTVSVPPNGGHAGPLRVR